LTSAGFLPLAVEGRRLLIREAAAAAVLLALAWFFARPALGALLVITASAMGFTLFFFREPVFEPDTPESGFILSPSYGTVLGSAVEDGRPVVRIFLSVLDVHAQYSPVEGRVLRTGFHGSAYAAAFKKEASANLRNRIDIELPGGEELGVEQIAGSIARRISCPLKPGDGLEPGDRLGLIYFGSQVAVFLPPGAEPLARPGSRVYPCRTVIGRLNNSDGGN